jgi:hypothetical protein
MNQRNPTASTDQGRAWPKISSDESPQTDPTNPWHQEAVSIFVAHEHASALKVDEPGLTNKDREEREPKG